MKTKAEIALIRSKPLEGKSEFISGSIDEDWSQRQFQSEVTEISKEVYDKLLSRLRNKNKKMIFFNGSEESWIGPYLISGGGYGGKTMFNKFDKEKHTVKLPDEVAFIIKQNNWILPFDVNGNFIPDRHPITLEKLDGE